MNFDALVPSFVKSFASTTSTCIPASKELARFLGEKEGVAILNHLEEVCDVYFRVSENMITVYHDVNSSVTQIENELRTAWYEHDMKRGILLSEVHQKTDESCSATLTIAQAAIVSFFYQRLIRDSGISDMILDECGHVSWFGSADSLRVAGHLMNGLFQEHLGVRNEELSKDGDHAVPAAYAGSLEDNSTLSMRYLTAALSTVSPTSPGVQSDSNQHLQNDQTGLSSFSSSSESQSKSRVGAVPVNPMDRKKERLLFMVRCTDAPRLIGTRGANKKRVEEATNCLITLHTESKRDGQFPVEVIGRNARQCETAKQHILAFISSGQTSNEEKKFRERPKVHLEFSPKKAVTTPRKTQDSV